MNEQEMQAELAAQRELIAALSGRIDRFDRENFSRNMRDARTDKRIFGHGDSLRDHVGDGLAHVIRDGMEDRGIPGMDDLSDEAVAAGVVIAHMKTSAAGSNTLTLDTKILEGDSSIIECDTANYKFKIKANGNYFIGLHANVNMQLAYGYTGLSTTSVSIWKNQSKIYEGGGMSFAMNVGTTGNSINFPVFASASLPTVLSIGDTIFGMVELSWYAGASMYVIKLP
jgi:hypothetical protein